MAQAQRHEQQAEKVDVDAYMRLYVGDWLVATAELSLEEQGAYLRILCHMWRRDGWLVLEPEKLARLLAVDRATWDRLWATLKDFFTVDPDGGLFFTQKRLLAELATAKEARTKASNAGRAGGIASGAARSRKGGPANDRSTSVEPSLNDRSTDVQPTLNGGATNHPSSVIRHPSGSETEGIRSSPRPPTPAPVPEKVSAQSLMRAFGSLRAELLNAMPWNIGGDTEGRTAAFVAGLDDAAKADLVPTMRLFLQHVKAGTGNTKQEPRMRDPTFAFACWRGRFTSLREELHGKLPQQEGAVSRCGYHAVLKNRHLEAPPNDRIPWCPECVRDAEMRKNRALAERQQRPAPPPPPREEWPPEAEKGNA